MSLENSVVTVWGHFFIEMLVLVTLKFNVLVCIFQLIKVNKLQKNFGFQPNMEFIFLQPAVQSAVMVVGLQLYEMFTLWCLNSLRKC